MLQSPRRLPRVDISTTSRRAREQARAPHSPAYTPQSPAPVYPGRILRRLAQDVSYGAGQVVSTVAGGSESAWVNQVGTAARFSYPMAVALSGDEALLYVGDFTRIRVINLASGQVSDVAGRTTDLHSP